MSSSRRTSGNDSVVAMVFAHIENAHSFSSTTLTRARRCRELMVGEMLRLIAAIRADAGNAESFQPARPYPPNPD